jgi:hypothetical protein
VWLSQVKYKNYAKQKELLKNIINKILNTGITSKVFIHFAVKKNKNIQKLSYWHN